MVLFYDSRFVLVWLSAHSTVESEARYPMLPMFKLLLSAWAGIVRIYNSSDVMIEDWRNGHYVVGHPHLRRLEERLGRIFYRPTVVVQRGMAAVRIAVEA